MKAYAIFLACEAAAVFFFFFFSVTVKISMIWGNKRLHVHLCIATLHFLPSIVSHTCLNWVDISLDLIHTNHRDVLFWDTVAQWPNWWLPVMMVEGTASLMAHCGESNMGWWPASCLTTPLLHSMVKPTPGEAASQLVCRLLFSECKHGKMLRAGKLLIRIELATSKSCHGFWHKGSLKYVIGSTVCRLGLFTPVFMGANQFEMGCSCSLSSV